jgi:hypothetical protein
LISGGFVSDLAQFVLECGSEVKSDVAVLSAPILKESGVVIVNGVGPEILPWVRVGNSELL